MCVPPVLAEKGGNGRAHTIHGFLPCRTLCHQIESAPLPGYSTHEGGKRGPDITRSAQMVDRAGTSRSGRLGWREGQLEARVRVTEYVTYRKEAGNMKSLKSMRAQKMVERNCRGRFNVVSYTEHLWSWH